MPELKSPGQIELRNLLHEPLAQKELGQYAKEIDCVRYLMCWIDIEEYKSSRSYAHRREIGTKIMYYYIKQNSPLDIQLSEEDVEYYNKLYKQKFPITKRLLPTISTYQPILNGSSGDTTHKQRLETSLFDKLQTKCFVDLYEKVFVPFKQATSYIDLRYGEPFSVTNCFGVCADVNDVL